MKFAGGAGYLNVDLLFTGLEHLPEEGKEIYSREFDTQIGGGVPATMINMARLGIPVKLLTFLGRDFFSDFVRKELDRFPIDYENLYTGDQMPVTVTAAMVTETDRSFLSFRNKKTVTPQIEEKIYQELKGARVVEMQEDFLHAYQRLKREGTVLVLDTGWSEELSVENYRPYLETADFYTPNRKEALKITGTGNLKDAAEVLSSFFEQVIIKLDADGCMIKDRAGTRIIPPLPGVLPVDATGAGDAFLSGFLFGLYEDYPLDDCVLFGNITGGTCVQSVGCLSSYVNREELLGIARKLKG
ncbi:carbohydrate kinase family protein [Lachnospiraceae bacterium ASD4241]|uniref:Carbohydrate kinase family protein n=2 Tax=Diplocloster modestus TaxID=2850322 RepID=A0ABS6K7V3_9FIRM|nr:carbohydrate kinase family protein [Diplocloster modestus]